MAPSGLAVLACWLQLPGELTARSVGRSMGSARPFSLYSSRLAMWFLFKKYYFSSLIFGFVPVKRFRNDDATGPLSELRGLLENSVLSAFKSWTINVLGQGEVG